MRGAIQKKKKRFQELVHKHKKIISELKYGQLPVEKQPRWHPQLFSDHSLEDRARFVFSTDAVWPHQHNFPLTPGLLAKFGSLQLHPLPKNENQVKRCWFWDPESTAKSWVKGDTIRFLRRQQLNQSHGDEWEDELEVQLLNPLIASTVSNKPSYWI